MSDDVKKLSIRDWYSEEGEAWRDVLYCWDNGIRVFPPANWGNRGDCWVVRYLPDE